MALTPDARSLDQRSQRFAVLRERVAHRCWHSAGAFAAYQIVRFELAKLLDEHLVRHRRRAPLQLPKLMRFTSEPIKDRELPPTAYGDEYCIERTVRERIGPRRAGAVTYRCVLVHRGSVLYLCAMRTHATSFILMILYAMPSMADDAAHAFDSHIGTWHTMLKRLKDPLTSSSTWLAYEGTTTVRAVLHGRANLAELEVEGEAGRIDGISLRLYDPRTEQWTLNYANLANGTLTTPSIGRFEGTRGEFYSDEVIGGRDVRVRFVIEPQGSDVIRFEQAFSIDNGRTWEVNWIATDTRVGPPDEAKASPPAALESCR